MKRRKFLESLGAGAAVTLAGCSDILEEETTSEEKTKDKSGKLVVPEEDTKNDGEIRAHYDPESEMVCFTYRDQPGDAVGAGGLSCRHIDETGYNETDFGYSQTDS